MQRFFGKPRYHHPESGVPSVQHAALEEEVPRDDKPSCELSLDELRVFASQASLHELIPKAEFTLIMSLVTHQLITVDMLQPASTKISVVNLLLASSQVSIVEALVTQQRVTPEQLNDKSQYANAIYRLVQQQQWPLLQRLMKARLIPVSALFKGGINADTSCDLDENALKLAVRETDRESKEAQEGVKALNQYAYDHVKTLIDANDLATIKKWLIWFVAQKPMLALTQVIDYAIQAKNQFADKIYLVWFYAACATNNRDKSASKSNQEFKIRLLFKVVETAAKLATDVTALDEMTQYLRSENAKTYLHSVLGGKSALIQQIGQIVATETASRKPVLAVRLGG